MVGDEGGGSRAVYSRVPKVSFALWGHRGGRGYSRVSLCCSASTRAALVPWAQAAQHSLGADLTVNLLLLGAQRGALVKPAGPAESLAEMKGSRRHEDISTGTEGVKRPLSSSPWGSELCLDDAGCQLGYVQSLCLWARHPLSCACIHTSAPERSPVHPDLSETNFPEALLLPTIPVSAYFPCSVRCSAHTSTPGKKCRVEAWHLNAGACSLPLVCI